MRKINLLLMIMLLVAVLKVNAQNIGIGIATPNSSAKLDITDASRGLLIPRIALTATNAAGPVTTPATSLLVYNTATAGVFPNNVIPGYYYWDGLKWVRLKAGNTDDWSLFGNTAINDPAVPATYGTTAIGATENYLGTTDANDVVLGTNNIERFRLKQTTGNIGIGTSAPTTKLEVSSGAIINAIYGHSNNVGGYLGYESNISIGNPAQTLLGAGVFASNPAAGYTGSFSQSTGAATVAASINYSNVWMASYNYVDNTSATNNPRSGYNYLSNTSTTLGGDHIALQGFSDRGTTAGNPGYTIGVSGISTAQNQDAIGLAGYAYTNTTFRAGGYFESLNYTSGVSQAYAYVGTSVGGVNRKITGTAAVSEIVPTPDHGRILLTCPESPEYWYQDYGTVVMINGRAHVELDPILASIIFVTEEYPIRAYFTPVEMLYFNGATITNKTSTGFDVVELNGGDHSGKLDYMLIVKPKTGFGEGRFPQAPGPSCIKPENEPQSAKAANQTAGKNIFYWKSDAETYGYEDVAKKSMEEKRKVIQATKP